MLQITSGKYACRIEIDDENHLFSKQLSEYSFASLGIRDELWMKAVIRIANPLLLAAGRHVFY